MDAIDGQQESWLLLDGLLEAFDRAYVDFEKAYVGFLISVETSCKSILMAGIALVALIDDGNTQAYGDHIPRRYFVAVLQKLNSVANIVGKGRQDLDYSIYAGAKKLFLAGHLQATCGRVLDVYERAARYFEKLGEPDALDRVCPDSSTCFFRHRFRNFLCRCHFLN